MKLGVYDTEGPEGEARGGASEGKEQDRGERAKRASEGGKSKAEEPPKRGGGEATSIYARAREALHTHRQ